MVAHESQLHAVPDAIGDEAAVMVEPTACAVHAAPARRRRRGDIVVVLGAGTLGLLSVAALRRFTGAGTIVAAAKHPGSSASWPASWAPTSCASPTRCPGSCVA